MTSLNTTNIIARLPGNQVLVQKGRAVDNPNEKSEEENRTLQKLKNRDQEVRLHEAQHNRNPGTVSIGGPQYTYTIGPDGKVYATGGQVMVTTGASGDPKTALRKARALKSAALSTGEPSSMDMAAAVSAREMEMEAIIKLAREEKEKQEGLSIHVGNNKTGPENHEGVRSPANEKINKYQSASTALRESFVNHLV